MLVSHHWNGTNRPQTHASAPPPDDDDDDDDAIHHGVVEFVVLYGAGAMDLHCRHGVLCRDTENRNLR